MATVPIIIVAQPDWLALFLADQKVWPYLLTALVPTMMASSGYFTFPEMDGYKGKNLQ